MKKRPEKITITEARRLAADEQQRRLEAASDAAIAEYQRALGEIHARGGSRVVGVPQDDGTLWYVEPHDAGDDIEGPAPVQHLGHYENDWEANGDPDPSLPDDRIKVKITTTDGVVRDGWMSLKVPPVVVKPPGARIMQLIDYLPAKGILRKDLAQVVADMREEHFECLAIGDKRGARAAVWRGRWEVACAIFPSWMMGLVSWAARWFAARFFQGS